MIAASDKVIKLWTKSGRGYSRTRAAHSSVATTRSRRDIAGYARCNVALMQTSLSSMGEPPFTSLLHTSFLVCTHVSFSHFLFTSRYRTSIFRHAIMRVYSANIFNFCILWRSTNITVCVFLFLSLFFFFSIFIHVENRHERRDYTRVPSRENVCGWACERARAGVRF